MQFWVAHKKNAHISGNTGLIAEGKEAVSYDREEGEGSELAK